VTATVHDVLPAIVPPVKLTVPEPAVAVAVPPHVFVRFGVDATIRPAGRLSVNPTPVSGVDVFVFVTVNVSDVVVFCGIAAAPNTFVIDGGAATVRFALAVLPEPPFVDVTAPVVFVYWPDVAPVTVTLNWHWPFTAIVAPVREMPVGAAVVNVPPQTVDVLFATVRPAGRVSLNATPVSGFTFAAGFVIVNVSEVVAATAIVEGVKTLAIDGGVSTLMFAVLLVEPVPPSVDVIAPVVLA
jgi:hypothetical protein